MDRFEYVVALPNRPPRLRHAAGLEFRHPTPEDLEALASLMLDAYRGTVDYDGETIDEARTEVRDWLEGSPLLSDSFVGLSIGSVVSACLVSASEPGPLIGYVMTAARHKSKGFASDLLELSLESLSRAGHQAAFAWITSGNHPSERIFRRAGFRRRRT